MAMYALDPEYTARFLLKRLSVELFLGYWGIVAFFTAHASDDVSNFASIEVFRDGLDFLAWRSEGAG